MNTTAFSTRAIIKSSWHIFKAHWKFLWAAGFLTLIIKVVLQFIQDTLRGPDGNLLLTLIATIIVFLIGIILALGWSKVFLGLVRSTHVTWNTFKTSPKLWLLVIKVAIIILVLVLAGGVAIALVGLVLGLISKVLGMVVFTVGIVVGLIYLALKYQFVVYIILDHPELGGRAVFKKAGALTKGHLLMLLKFGIVLGLFNLLGLICLVVGLAFTVPTAKIAQAKMYEHLKEKHVLNS